MVYRELINVAQGTKGQLDACISALDLHQDPLAEVEDLTMKLEEALQLCDNIIRLGEDEPEEQPPEPPTPAAPASDPSAEMAAEDPSALPPIFEDPAPAQ